MRMLDDLVAWKHLEIVLPVPFSDELYSATSMTRFGLLSFALRAAAIEVTSCLLILLWKLVHSFQVLIYQGPGLMLNASDRLDDGSRFEETLQGRLVQRKIVVVLSFDDLSLAQEASLLTLHGFFHLTSLKRNRSVNFEGQTFYVSAVRNAELEAKDRSRNHHIRRLG